MKFYLHCSQILKNVYLTYLNPARKHKHTHTLMSNTVAVCERIYLIFHIQFSCCPLKLLSVATVNFHTNNYRCIVTATLHAVPFRYGIY